MDAAVVVRFNVVLLIDLILFFLLLLFSLLGSCLLFLCLLFHLLCDIPSSHLLRRASAKDLEPKSVLLLLTVPVGALRCQHACIWRHEGGRVGAALKCDGVASRAKLGAGRNANIGKISCAKFAGFYHL